MKVINPPGKPGSVVNGGNTLGADLTIGTNDAFGVIFEVGGAPAAKLLSTKVFMVGDDFTSLGTTYLIQAKSTAADAAVLSWVTSNTKEAVFMARNQADLIVSAGIAGSASAGTIFNLTRASNSWIYSNAPTGLAIGTPGATPVYLCSNDLANVKLLSTGELIGGKEFTSVGATYFIQARSDTTDAGMAASVSSASKEAGLMARNSSNLVITLGMASTGVGSTIFGITRASMSWLYSNSVAGLAIGTESATPIYLCTSNIQQWSITSGGVLTAVDGKDIAFGTSTGTKIGTATSQKIGLWNATPVVQPSSTGEAAGYTGGGGTALTHTDTFTGDSGTKAYTINDIVKHLKAVGVLAAS